MELKGQKSGAVKILLFTFLIYRVELKGPNPTRTGGRGEEFLIYRVELKVAIIDYKRFTGSIKFLIYRVELKDFSLVGVCVCVQRGFLIYRVELKAHTTLLCTSPSTHVPNLPCGVERTT